MRCSSLAVGRPVGKFHPSDMERSCRARSAGGRERKMGTGREERSSMGPQPERT